MIKFLKNHLGDQTQQIHYRAVTFLKWDLRTLPSLALHALCITDYRAVSTVAKIIWTLSLWILPPTTVERLQWLYPELGQILLSRLCWASGVQDCHYALQRFKHSFSLFTLYLRNTGCTPLTQVMSDDRDPKCLSDSHEKQFLIRTKFTHNSKGYKTGATTHAISMRLIQSDTTSRAPLSTVECILFGTWGTNLPGPSQHWEDLGVSQFICVPTIVALSWL